MLGANAIAIDNSYDLNDCTTQGLWYLWSTKPTNSPFANGMLKNERMNVNWIRQTCYQRSETTPKSAYRLIDITNSVYGEWKYNYDESILSDSSILSPLANALGVTNFRGNILFDTVSGEEINNTGNTKTERASNLLKEICAKYSSNEYMKIHIGRCHPSSAGFYIVFIYSTNNVDSNGIPQYSWGFYMADTEINIVGSNNHSVIAKTVSAT